MVQDFGVNPESYNHHFVFRDSFVFRDIWVFTKIDCTSWTQLQESIYLTDTILLWGSPKAKAGNRAAREGLGDVEGEGQGSLGGQL